ncbi:hypothetical protein COCON_G00078250 [Conger conger]|uniref:Uncharacterized protein n=1 Tax=Conger conger TaxID=82655 RepID=A0A9Q1DP40_CONCO|nr:hypothetical protein COCON_G00078250 [Conger conger]
MQGPGGNSDSSPGAGREASPERGNIEYSAWLAVGRPSCSFSVVNTYRHLSRGSHLGSSFFQQQKDHWHQCGKLRRDCQAHADRQRP